MKKNTAKMKSKRPYWQHQGKDGINSKGNDTISEIPDIEPMCDQIIIMKEATTLTETIKQVEKVDQYLMGTDMGAGSMVATRRTSGKRNKIRQRDPRTTFHVRK